MKTLFTAAALTVASFGMAQAASIDFEGFATGTAINSVMAGGVTATVTTNSNRSVGNGGTNQAVVFDSDNPTGNDSDLGAPFGDVNGMLPDLIPGKILIIAGPNNGPGLPDDDAQGGSITFDFDRLVNITSFNFIDSEANGNEIVVSTNTGFTSGLLVAGNAQFGLFDTPLNGVSSLTFTFGGSGAIDNIAFAPVPVPAALPLLAFALGGLGFAARRRRDAA